MSTQVQFRRGTTTQNNAFTGAVAELTYDTDAKTLRIHDGSTPGGGSVVVTTTATQGLLNKTLSTGSVWNGNAISLAYGGTGRTINTPIPGGIAYGVSNGMILGPQGTSGQVLISGGDSAPSWVASTSLQAGNSVNATYATNIAGGSAGQLIIQQDNALTTFITAGDAGTFLKSNGAGYAPGWASANITIGSTVIDLGSSSTSLNGLNIVAATGTSHWTLPVGTTAERPGSPAIGMVRYNSTQSTFEGFSSGAWSSLGGVKSVDGLTYITAETSAGASNDELEFYAATGSSTTAKVGGWNATRLLVSNTTAATSSSTGALVVSGGLGVSGAVYVGGTLNVTGNLSVSGTTTTTNSQSLTVTTPQLFLSSDNTGNSTDVGLLGGYTVGGVLKKTGLVKQAASNEWRLFSNTTASPGTTYDFTGVVYDTLRLSGIIGTGNSSVGGTFSVSGATTLAALTTTTLSSSSGTFSGTLGVTGAVTFSSALTVTGQITGGSFQTSSDARLKSNIQDSEYGLDTVMQLRSVKYERDNKSEIGLIAQEVKEITPEFVGESNGYMTVNYAQMVSVLVKAVQELSAEVNALKAKLGE
jgi:hypothetical protein